MVFSCFCLPHFQRDAVGWACFRAFPASDAKITADDGKAALPYGDRLAGAIFFACPAGDAAPAVD